MSTKLILDAPIGDIHVEIWSSRDLTRSEWSDLRGVLLMLEHARRERAELLCGSYEGKPLLLRADTREQLIDLLRQIVTPAAATEALERLEPPQLESTP